MATCTVQRCPALLDTSSRLRICPLVEGLRATLPLTLLLDPKILLLQEG